MSRLLRDRLLLGLSVLVCIIGAFYVRRHTFTEPLEADEATYMVIAQDWIDGGKPYVTAWDNKPILTFVIYRIGIHLFGYHELAPRLTSAIAVFLLIALLMVFLARRYGLSVSLGGGVLLVLFNTLIHCHANGANMEIYQLPLVLLVYVLCHRLMKTGGLWVFAAAVLAIVTSTLIKQVTVPLMGLPFVSLWLHGERRTGRLALLVLASAVGGILVYTFVYGVCGFPPSRFFMQLTQNATRLPSGEGNPGLLFLRLLFTFPFEGPIRRLLPLSLLGLVGLAVRLRSKELRNEQSLLAAFVVMSLLSAILPGDKPHYFLLLLPAILLIFVDLASWSRRLHQSCPAVAMLCATVYLGVFAYTGYFRKDPSMISVEKYGWAWFVGDRFIGRQLQANGITGEILYVDGCHPGVLFYSRCKPATKYFTHWPISQGVADPDKAYEEVMASRPGFFAVTNPTLEPAVLREFVARNYTKATDVRRKGVVFAKVYRLKPSPEKSQAN